MTITNEPERRSARGCRGLTIDRSANQRLEFGLTNLACAGATATLSERFRSVKAATDAVVNPVTERTVIEFNPREANVEEILAASKALGITIQPVGLRWHLQLEDAACPACVRAACREAMQIIGVQEMVYDGHAHGLTVGFTVPLADLKAVIRAIEAVHCCDTRSCRQ